MGRNKEEEARRSGMGYALKVILDAHNSGKDYEDAVDALRKELQFRNITKAPLMIPKSQVDDWCEGVKNNCATSFKLAMLITLADRYDWNREQLMEFMEHFNDKVDTLLSADSDGEMRATWKDYSEILWDELSIKVDLTDDMKDFYKKEG